MAAKPKPFPKTLGACADLLAVKREARLVADKAAAELKKDEQALIDYIIDKLPKDSSGAMGKTHKVKVIVEQKLIVEDWDAFYAYVGKAKAFDMLQKRLSPDAVQARLDDKKKVPGVGTFNAVKVSLTKV